MLGGVDGAWGYQGRPLGDGDALAKPGGCSGRSRRGPGQGVASQEEGKGGAGLERPMGQVSSGGYGNETLGALCGVGGKDSHREVSGPVWNFLPRPTPAAIRESPCSPFIT